MSEEEKRAWMRVPCCRTGFESGGGIAFMMGSGIPEECSYCGGSKFIWRSPRGRLAQYPGGPFLGSEPRKVSS